MFPDLTSWLHGLDCRIPSPDYGKQCSRNDTLHFWVLALVLVIVLSDLGRRIVGCGSAKFGVR